MGGQHVNPKKPIPRSIARRVYERDGRRCRYCGNTSGPFHLDHVYPESKGGETSVRNLVVACKTCNIRKYTKVGQWPLPLNYFDMVDEMERLEKDRLQLAKIMASKKVARMEGRYFLAIFIYTLATVLPMGYTSFGLVDRGPWIDWILLAAILIGAVYFAVKWQPGWERRVYEAELNEWGYKHV
jgi:hypothetical protein